MKLFSFLFLIIVSMNASEPIELEVSESEFKSYLFDVDELGLFYELSGTIAYNSVAEAKKAGVSFDENNNFGKKQVVIRVEDGKCYYAIMVSKVTIPESLRNEISYESGWLVQSRDQLNVYPTYEIGKLPIPNA